MKKIITLSALFFLAMVIGKTFLGKAQAFTIATINPASLATASTAVSTATSAKTASAAADEKVNQNIKNRIEKVVEEKISGAQTIVRKKRAVVGTLERINAEAITIKTMHGDVTAKLSDDTVVLYLPKLQPAQLQDIELHSFTIVMGFVNEDDVLEARRILINPEPLFPTEKEVLIGTVDNIGKTSISLTLRNQEKRTVLLGKKIIFRSMRNEKLAKTDIKTGMEVILVVPKELPDENGNTATPSAILLKTMKEVEKE